MKRPTHLGIHHVALYVENLNQVCDFYVDCLGYHIEWQPDASNIYLTCGRDNLALHQGFAPEGPQRLDHLGILVAKPQDVADWEAYLRSRDVTIVASTRTHRDGATSCHIQDPAGNLLQIIYHPPISHVLHATHI